MLEEGRLQKKKKSAFPCKKWHIESLNNLEDMLKKL